jgi:hypothetical protein
MRPIRRVLETKTVPPDTVDERRFGGSELTLSRLRRFLAFGR